MDDTIKWVSENKLRAVGKTALEYVSKVKVMDVAHRQTLDGFGFL